MQEEIVLVVVIVACWDLCWVGNTEDSEDITLSKLIVGNSSLEIFLNFEGVGESSELYKQDKATKYNKGVHPILVDSNTAYFHKDLSVYTHTHFIQETSFFKMKRLCISPSENCIFITWN